MKTLIYSGFFSRMNRRSSGSKLRIAVSLDVEMRDGSECLSFLMQRGVL
jgi:hypothetical protein